MKIPTPPGFERELSGAKTGYGTSFIQGGLHPNGNVHINNPVWLTEVAWNKILMFNFEDQIQIWF